MNGIRRVAGFGLAVKGLRRKAGWGAVAGSVIAMRPVIGAKVNSHT